MVARRPVVTLDAALHHLSRLIGVTLDWAELSAFLPADYDGPLRRSAVASSFLAALELARQGRVDLKQDGAFEPHYLKAVGTLAPSTIWNPRSRRCCSPATERQPRGQLRAGAEATLRPGAVGRETGGEGKGV